ncbi:hypothetical protein [Staphylococcus epidermidis]|uniref:hypothetical protein n=1 Tax=Staphylococcus epidermidis TaxID=1282 RepID=UPI0011A1A349|nr:hypothetical protein [Staphylococcus epidermidis]
MVVCKNGGGWFVGGNGKMVGVLGNIGVLEEEAGGVSRRKLIIGGGKGIGSNGKILRYGL